MKHDILDGFNQWFSNNNYAEKNREKMKVAWASSRADLMLVNNTVNILELFLELEPLLKILDKEEAHIRADNILLKYIDDSLVTQVFNSIDKYYN